MTLDLSGKVAIVTGASRGIGRAVAVALAGAGAAVVCGARGANAQPTAEAIVAQGAQAISASLDVTDAASAAAAVELATTRFGRLDVLVCNAGITDDQLLLRMKRDDWDSVISTNLTGTFLCTQAAIRPMVRQRGGRVICISSVVGQMGNAGQANYAASKAGIIGFAKSVARELASRNITVNVVAPGLIDTDMTRNITEQAKTDWASQIPLGRLGKPEEVAAAVCFLASDAAAYITGQVLAVNGGMYL